MKVLGTEKDVVLVLTGKMMDLFALVADHPKPINAIKTHSAE